MKDFVFLDGKPLYKNLPLRSLLYGEGVFETFRWKGRAPVFIKKHLSRMKRGAKFLNIPWPGDDAVARNLNKAVFRAGLQDAYAKVCLLASGSLKFYAHPDAGHLLVVVRKYERPKEYLRAHVSPFKRISSSAILSLKSVNYLENVVARRNAEKHGCDEAIFLNERGEVAEGSATNIFWTKDGKLFTPSLDCGILPGITREVVISLARRLNLKVEEGRFKLDKVLRSQGAFLTNSLVGIAAITEIDGTKINKDEELFGKLRLSLHRELGWAD